MSQPYDRVFNFSAGPCALPVEILEEARDDLLNYKGTGKSVMEMSHRSKDFEAIRDATVADFRKLLSIPDTHHAIFVQGGASLQNSMIPLSFLKGTADYVTTGAWGAKAYEAAVMVGDAKEIWSGKSTNFDRCPTWDSISVNPKADYFYYTSNETIHGVQFKSVPKLDVPIVCDMSSDILSEPMDVSPFSLIFAGAQKNMGPAGVVAVIISKEFLDRAPKEFHPMLDYRLHVENDSMYNTPPCWAIYMCGLNYKYMLRNGGLEACKKHNQDKAALIYKAIDCNEEFYEGHSLKEWRSPMNITFRLKNKDLEGEFFAEAKANKLDDMKGHRSVGGIRASIYNAMPKEGCQALADFMNDFAKRKG